MKITVEHYDRCYELKIPDEIQRDELVYIFDGLLKLLGYNYNGSLEIVKGEK